MQVVELVRGDKGGTGAQQGSYPLSALSIGSPTLMLFAPSCITETH